MFKLLIADDEDFVLDGLVRNICWSELGIDSIEVAEDGMEALEKAVKFKPDIILSDIKMLPIDGIELVSKVKNILPNCKIIFMSAYSEKEFLKSAINFKAVSYVEKPIDLEEIKDAITSAVMMCMEDEKKKIAERPLQSSITLELINPGFSRERILKYLKTSGMETIIEGDSCVINIKYRVKKDDDNRTIVELKDEVYRVVYEALSMQELACLSAYVDNKCIIMIIYSKHYGKPLEARVIKQACQEALREISKRMDIFIGIGIIVNSMDNVWKSFKSSEALFRELFFNGYNHIAVSGGFKEDPGEPEGQSEPKDLFESNLDAFSRYLENGEREKSVQFIKELTRKAKLCQNNSVNHAKNLYLFLLVQLLNIAVKYQVELFTARSREFFWQKLLECDTLQDVEEYVVKTLDSFFEEMEDRAAKGKLVSNVIRIISNSYSDPALSVKAISNKVFLNHTYLCVAFKKVTGKTINQYITEFRVQKAKELLKNNAIKLSDIAKSVGYTDQNYFTKVFKKVANMKPSEYRERYL